MGKYFVGDIVRTKNGIGQIVDIWEINDMITVFSVQVFSGWYEDPIIDMYYGDIVNKVALEDLEFKGAY